MNLGKSNDCIIPLIEYLRDWAPSTLIKVNITITPTEFEVTETHKSADDLKIQGISMKNFQGEFIKYKEIKLEENND